MPGDSAVTRTNTEPDMRHPEFQNPQRIAAHPSVRTSDGPRHVPFTTAGLLALAIVAGGALPACSQQPETASQQEADEDATESIESFAVYALSRGKGVPPEAREALKQIEELVEADRERGIAVSTERERIGIEGETRFCAAYEDSEAAAATFHRAAELIEGVDLINLVAEPCSAEESDDDTKEN